MTTDKIFVTESCVICVSLAMRHVTFDITSFT